MLSTSIGRGTRVANDGHALAVLPAAARAATAVNAAGVFCVVTLSPATNAAVAPSALHTESLVNERRRM